MFVFRAGQLVGEKSLGLVLRHRWRALQLQRQATIDARKKLGTPLVDEGNKDVPLLPLPDYDGEEEVDDVVVDFEVLPRDQWEEFNNEWNQALDKNREAQEAVCRSFLSRCLRTLRGIETVDGEYTLSGQPDTDDLDLFQENLLLTPLFFAGMHLHSLPRDARKNCGALQRLTSPGTTATVAARQKENNVSVVVERQKLNNTGAIPSTVERTSTTPVPNA